MEGQTKISPRKVARFVIGSLLVAIFMVTLVAASRTQAGHAPKGLEVTILNENEHDFIRHSDIERMLVLSGDKFASLPIAELNLDKLEKTIETNPWVVNAEVFVDNARKLRVQVMQRVPVARIFMQNGSSCYMDSSLKMLPLSATYAYSAPVFTNVPVFNNDDFGRSFKAKIAFLSRLIANDTFWNAQITQIEVQPDQTFILTPMLGSQKILFGDTADARRKFENLFAFYKNVSTKIGWDKYQVLDVRYKEQVVASPAIGYIPPPAIDTTKNTDIIAVRPVAATAAPVSAGKAGATSKAGEGQPQNRSSGRATSARQQAGNDKVKPAGKPVRKEKQETVKPAKAAAEGKYIYQGKK